MKNLIKQVLNEEIHRKNLEDLIRQHRYESNLLDTYMEKMESGLELSEIDLILADEELRRMSVLGKLKKNILAYIRTNTTVQDIIKQKGTIVYIKLISGDKKDILNSIFLDKVFQIGKPSDEWFEKNIEDITKITTIFPDLKAKMAPSLKRCKEKNYMGIIKKEGDYFVWTILNKINTNYINWGDLISEKVANQSIKITRALPSELAEAQEIIDEYFIQRSVLNFNIDEDLKSIITTLKIRSLSFAEMDIIEAFYLYLNEKGTERFDKIISNIQSTSSQGDNVENNFMSYLSDYKNIVEDIHSFSSPGNLVDMELGIDLLAKIKGVYYAIQVKSSESHANSAKIKYQPVNYLVIYPKNQLDPEEFYYITKKTNGGDFNQLMSSFSKETKSPPKTPLPPPNYDYLKWAGLDPDA